MAYAQDKTPHALVVTIGFGSTFSGLAYQFSCDYITNPAKVHIKSWTNGTNNSSKAPTTVLIKPDGKTLHSFGYEAEDKFAKLYSARTHESWYYFDEFQMQLMPPENIHGDICLKAHNGKRLRATHVYSSVIAHLKQDLMKTVKKQQHKNGRKQLAEDGIAAGDVFWVLTVPTTWSDGGIELIRHAADMAGIEIGRMRITKEPEAAVVFCKQILSEHNPNTAQTTAMSFSPGQTILVLDTGGHTTNISVFQVLPDNTLRECTTPIRINVGGRAVNQAFINFLIKLFGKSVIETLQNTYAEEYLTLLRKFEKQKRKTNKKPCYIRLTATLATLVKTMTNKSVRETITLSQFTDGISVGYNNKLKIEASVMRDFHMESIKNITAELVNVMRDHRVKGCNTILMIGGYSECELLQQEIRRIFPHIHISIPKEASLVVLKGAVLSGWNPQPLPQLKPSHAIIVAAIDFGTAFSGWAFQFIHEYNTNPMQMYAKNWNNGTNISNKAPTTALIYPDGQRLHSFGYDAEDKFAESASEEVHEPLLYFRHFKMQLYETTHISMDMTIRAHNGVTLPALTVFSLVIEHLKKDLENEVKRMVPAGIPDQQVLWVLTVPAIWNDGAKHFMKQAAIRAGIDGDNLRISLEPEVASVYCKHLPLDCNNQTSMTFTSGKTYLLMDAGGGTVDFNVFEIIPTGNLRQLHRSTGNDRGGIAVDREFLHFLKEIFGDSTIEKLQNEHLDEYFDILRDFEVQKRKTADIFHVRLPRVLMDMFQSENRCDIGEKLANSGLAELGVNIKNGHKLSIPASVMGQFFWESIKNITAQLKLILNQLRVKSCNTIIMVGGYSECGILQAEIKQKFSHMDVVIPREASMAVLKGAVMFGWDPQVIASRVCKYTYGVGGMVPYNPAIHPRHKLYFDNYGRKMIADSFDKIVEIGQDVSLGEIHKGGITGKYPGDRTVGYLPIFASTKRNPKFTYDYECFLVGLFKFDHKDRFSNISEVTPMLSFGDTELDMTIEYATTKAIQKATFWLPN